MEEEWRPIEGVKGTYLVSSEGRVYSQHSKRYLKPFRVGQDGQYRAVHLPSLSGDGRHRMVHVLVAKAFVPNPLGLPEVNHIDADKNNNRMSNLEWTNRRGNISHYLRLGLGSTKLSDDQVREIRRRSESGERTHSIVSDFPVSYATVWDIVKGRTYTHVSEEGK